MSESTMSLGKGVEEFSEAVSARIGEIRSELGNVDRQARALVQEYPLVALAAAALSGYLLARLIRARE
jgi:phytoene/squalene synthetase